MGAGEPQRRVVARLCYAVGLAVVAAVLFPSLIWRRAAPPGQQSDPSAVTLVGSSYKPALRKSHPHPKTIAWAESQPGDDAELTTTRGNYFDTAVRMDGLLRTLDDRVDAIMRPIFGASHASNLLELPDGTLLLVWFSGGDEGGDGVGIVSARLTPGATQWTKPLLASSEPGRSGQNPVVFYEASEGAVKLLHTSQVAYMGQSTAEVRFVESHDGGLSWEKPKTLFTEPGAFVKNQLLRSKDDSEWLLPMYYTPDGFHEHSTHYSTVKRSSDGGRTWKEYVMTGTLGRCVQPTVVRLQSGALRSWFRSRDADFIYVSDSTDDGKTWSIPVATSLPNNNSGIQATMLKNGNIALVFNNLQGPYDRYPLSVALSLDEGSTWPFVRDLEPTSSRHGTASTGQQDAADFSEHGEYSYPSIIQTTDGAIHVSYTFRRESIRYAKISEQWIKDGFSIGLHKGG